MKILIDENVPVQVRKAFSGHQATTVREQGWGQFVNGELLRAADGKFDLFVTCDKNLKHQQNLGDFRISILELSMNNRRIIEANFDAIRDAIDAIRPGQLVVLRLAAS